MYLILEWNGVLPDGWIGECLNEQGDPIFFNTYLEAHVYASQNCAFNYKIVMITF